MRVILLLLLLLAALLPGCRQKHGEGAPPPARADAAAIRPAPDARPTVTAAGISRVLLFTARWCSSCHQLEHDVIGSARPGAARIAGAPVEEVDFDAPVNRSTVTRFGVTGLPTVVFLDGQGEEKDRIEGFEGREPFLAEVRAIASGRDLIHLLRDQVARAPANLELKAKLGGRLLALGREAEARKVYDAVLAADPANRSGEVPKVLMHLGRYLVRVKGDLAAATAHLESALQRFPDGKDGERFAYWLGLARCQAGQKPAAVAGIDAWAQARGNPPAAVLLRADLRQTCGHDLPRALTLAQEGVAAKPRDDWGWYLVAVLSHALGRAADVAPALDRAIQIDPRSAFYRNEKARLGGKR